MGPKRNTVQEVTPTPRHHIWLVCIAISVATFAIYAQVLQFEFVNWDDPDYVYNNPHIAQGVTKSSIAWAFTSGYAVNWHPVTWISHMVDIELFGLERAQGASLLQGPGGHHLVSMLIHMANSLLLLWLLYRMTGAFWTSALVAALFAMHPLRVESVAWVSERKDVLSGFFFMLTLLSYQCYAKHPSLKRYLLVFISLALGLMSKPMLITVPFLLLLLDLWPLRRWKRPGLRFLILEKLPLFALVIASSLVTMRVQQAGGAVASLDRLPWVWRLVNAPVATVMYMVKTIWPTHLAFLYPHPANIQTELFGKWVLFAVAATLLLVLLSAVALRSLRTRPYLLVGWLWFLGMLVPVIGLLQVGNQAWADRYAYLPVLGLYLVISGSLAGWVQHRPELKRAVVGGVMIVLLGLLPITWKQVSVWRNSLGLYEHALAVTENNASAHINLGAFLQKRGQFEEAITHYRQALEIKPDDVEAHRNYGAALVELGRPLEALRYYQEAVRIRPADAKSHMDWGVASLAAGQSGQAIARFEQALRIKPEYPDAHYNWGAALLASGQPEEALVQYQKALRSKANFAEAHLGCGNALQRMGRATQAIAHYQEALKIKPDFVEAHNNWGNALLAMGHSQEAIEHYQQSLRIKPDHADALSNWGAALAESGRPQEAVARYQQALKFQADSPVTHVNLGNALRALGRLQEAVDHYQEALRIRPTYAEAYSSMGDALQLMDKAQEAVGYYQQALKLRPNIATTHNSLGLALNAAGRYEEAASHCRQALTLRPDFAEAYNNLGAIHVSMERLQDALKHFEEAVRLKPDYATARDNLKAVREELEREE